MKKALLLLCFISSFCYGQQKCCFGGAIDVTLAYKHVQYADQPVTINATPNIGITTWSWTAKDAETGATIDTETTEDPSFTLPVGLYDIHGTATRSGSTTWDRTLTDVIRVLAHRYTEGECNVVIDISLGGYFHNYSAAASPDWVIGIKGSGVASLNPYGLHGTAGHPATIQLLGNSDVNMTGEAIAAHALRMDGASPNGYCQYVIINGFKDDGTIGWHITASGSGHAQTVMFLGKYTNIDVLGIEVDSQPPAAGAAFSLVAAPTATINATNFEHQYCRVMYCRTLHASQESYYSDYNNDTPSGGFQPAKTMFSVVAWNEFNNSQRDCIQPGSAGEVRVHDNVCITWGLEQTSTQESCVSWNGGTYGKFYNNYCRHGNMAINIQSGQSPFRIFTGDTTPHDSYFFGNVFMTGTYSSPNSEPFAIYSQFNNTINGGTLNEHIYENTFIVDKKLMEQYYFAAPGMTSNKYTVANNVIVRTGDAGTTPEINFNGPGTHPNSGQYNINNILRTNASHADLLFTNEATGDLTISSFSSPVYFGSPTDIAARFTEMSNYLWDLLGFPLLAPGHTYTFGAYSGYQKR